MRPTIKGIYDLDDRTAKRLLLSVIGTLGGIYEVDVKPRRNTRSLRQNAAWWSMIVDPLFQFLRQQQYEIHDPEQAHAMLKEKLLRVAIINPETGEVAGYRTKSTAELDTQEFADLFDRARNWLDESFGIVVPDPDPDWRAQSPSRGLTAV